MGRIVVRAEVYGQCGLSPTEVLKIRVQLEKDLPNINLRRKKKWLENVAMGGAMYGVSCRKLVDETVEITNIKRNRR